jgi:hypothetical protein
MGQMQRSKQKIMHQAEKERRAETRTKIQLGGLVLKSKLANVVGITPGEDLQLDPQKWDQAALLLSLFTDMYEKARDMSSSEKQDHINKGLLGLKYDFFPES